VAGATGEPDEVEETEGEGRETGMLMADIEKKSGLGVEKKRWCG
jgi:hypothetical protein